MQRIFTLPFAQEGALSGDWVIQFEFPFDVQLLGFCSYSTNDNDATIKVGTDSDDDAYYTAAVVGDDGDTKTVSRTDLVGDQYPHIDKETEITITIDYDGAAGTAAEDLTLVFYFTEG